ncbi:MAG: substrate-binding domain-containing protein [Chloroflexota bacterium]
MNFYPFIPKISYRSGLYFLPLILFLLSSCTVAGIGTNVEVGETSADLFESLGGESDDQTAENDPSSTGTEVNESAKDIDTDVASNGEFNSVLLPKFMGLSVFEQANDGAVKAARSLRQPAPMFVGPASASDNQQQISLLNEAVANGYDAVLISNNAGDEIASAAEAALEAGVTIITWDSPIPSSVGENVFVAQVDFDETGSVMAEMANSILSGEGKIAILSASRDAANQNAWIAAMEDVLVEKSNYQNIELIDVVYGDDDYEKSYSQALELIKKHPDLDLIMAPTTVGIQAAAQAMQDEGICDAVKTSGLGLPEEMIPYMADDCVPEFALWSFSDLGYLTYYLAYNLSIGNIDAKEGETFLAGQMGQFTIEKDPTREEGLRVLMGSFTIYKAKDILWGE